MRLPQPPPNTATLFDQAGRTGRLIDVLHLADRVEEEAVYLHWDEVRRHPKRRGFSHEEVWLAHKLKRRAAYRALPLLDKIGQPFQFSIPDSLQDILHEIDFKAGGFIGSQSPMADPQVRDRYIVSSLIQEAITSSQLEGAVATREMAKDMIRSGRPARTRGERMILNNYRTMQRIIELKDEPMSINLLLKLHHWVTDETLDDPSGTGRFRRGDEEIRVMDDEGQVYHDPPAAEELEDRARKMCAFANHETPQRFIHPMLRSIMLHFWLAYDHPFTDGNGRTARALFYWSMLHHGFWLFEFVSISNILLKAPAQYARSFLYTETDENDLNYFILYQAEVIRRAIAALHTYIERKQRELQVVKLKTRYLHHLNPRQQAILSHALRYPAAEYTIESHRNSHKIAYATSRADLLDLVKLGLLRQGKRGKAMMFTAVSGLAHTLDEWAGQNADPTGSI